MNINDLPLIIIKCLIITIIIELIFAFLLKCRGKDLITVIITNIITNPIVVSTSFYFNFKFGLLGRDVSLTILEIMVLLSEAFIYKKYLTNKKINPYALSFVLNMLSFIIGEIINKFV